MFKVALKEVVISTIGLRHIYIHSPSFGELFHKYQINTKASTKLSSLLVQFWYTFDILRLFHTRTGKNNFVDVYPVC